MDARTLLPDQEQPGPVHAASAEGAPADGAPAGGGPNPPARPAAPAAPTALPLTWRRLVGASPAVSTLAAAAAVVAAAAETVAATVAGRIAEGPTTALVVVLAALLLGSTVLDTAGRTAFSGLVGRAEGRLRADLLHAALHQPVPVLGEQAVGEVLDRVDDDPRALGELLRSTGWQVALAGLRSVLAWVVAGLTWWPAWLAFPAVAALAYLVARPLTTVVAQRQVVEEESWSDHAAQLEEAVAGRDDVRSSLGQAHVVRQYSRRARRVLERSAATCRASAALTLRSGLVLQALLAALAVAGVALVGGGDLGVGELLTLWLLVTAFVGQLSQVSHHLPEVQEGLGALTRVLSLLTAPQEPAGGTPLPPGPAAVEFRDLTFTHPGGFSLRSVDLVVPAGTTCALVGRTGSGKSTLASMLSRALDPPPGTVLVAGQDVTATAVADLRRAVGVVTQRTEVLSATLEENITLFRPVRDGAVAAAVESLGLGSWVESLPDGLATRLGVGGTTLSAGEEQLVAFARLLVRDVSVVVLDEATARMDPQTEALVTAATGRLLAGRTGVVIAHRLSTTADADTVVVLDRGRVVQQGGRTDLAGRPGPFADLLRAAGTAPDGVAGASRPVAADGATPSGGAPAADAAGRGLASRADRRAPRAADTLGRPRLARSVLAIVLAHPRWGVVGGVAFAAATLLGAYGAVTGWLWGRLVADLERGGQPWALGVVLAGLLLLSPAAVALAFRTYPLWWSVVTLRLRLAVLRGQTMQHRLARTPPGEVAARALDSERLVIYADRWVDVVIGLDTAATTTVISGRPLAGAVVGAVMVVSALACAAGAPLAGSSAREAGDQRARFGRSLVSSLEAARTVTLAGATDAVQGHLGRLDARRVAASVREHRVRMLLEGVPLLLTQAAVVAAWAVHLAGGWDLATAILVSTTAAGFSWFGVVAGAVVTEVPVARRWLEATALLAGGRDLVTVPAGVDLVVGSAPEPPPAPRVPLQRLELDGVTAVHDDGTVGVAGVSLTVERGSLVLLAGRVGSGKSSLLAALAGLVDHEGDVRWNGRAVDDPERFLRPGQVAYVGQQPRVLSGSFHDNVALDHRRAAGSVEAALADARLGSDIEDAGGHGALVGHRGVRLSGGQVQRLALARALATEAELVVADDVSSALDARTELELWQALRARGVTVVGASSKRSALARADLVVVLEDGRVAETGPWAELADRWGHLAG